MHHIQKQINCLFKYFLCEIYDTMATLKCNVVQKQIENIITYLEPFLPLANSHMVDYFSQCLYENYLPCDLKKEILDIGFGEVLNIILNNKINTRAVKLNEYIDKTKSFHLYNIENICLSKADLNKQLSEWGCNDISSLKLEVFITPKKSHEVEILSKIAAAVSHINKTTHIIDIGDGKGYLSSMLALHHKIPVLGVDASLINTDGAVKRARMLAKVWGGITKNPKKSILTQSEQVKVVLDNLYKQVTQFVTENTDFEKLIRDVFLENSSRFGLVGLHTCGNLGSTSVKIFNNNKNIKTICNVSCCYHLLMEEFDEELSKFNPDTSIGFPMSAFLKNNNFELGRNARMLSAHSIDRILYKKELPNKVVFYRSILEILLEKRDICVKQRQVGKLRKGFKEFTDYADKALKNIDAGISVTSQELNELFDKYKKYEDQLNVFYLLRCMLAPVIESLILLDRLLFLHENKHESAFLIHLFDPVISPRCYGLIAFKQE